MERDSTSNTVWERPGRRSRIAASGGEPQRPRHCAAPVLAIRARYGDGELAVEARERYAIAAVVVLATLAAVSVIASLLV